ncbi:MAG: DMT family transporter [Acidimicrobiia bacterium]|nr:DMT family transporter [Acidimicrobiia bacterium]
MALLLGLFVAAGFGGADFLGGLASRRSEAGAVVLTAQTAGLLVAAAWLALFASGAPPGPDIAFGACAGIANVVGVAALYRGLGSGRMGVVAPVSAAVAATIPIVWGLLQGERPSLLGLCGAGIALVAVVLIARSAEVEDAHEHERRWVTELVLAVLAGAGFGLSFVLFAHTSEASGFWPVLAARVAAVPLTAAALGLGRRAMLPERGDRSTAVAAGLVDASVTALLLVAVRQELVTLVAPVSALYPGFTVLLARVVLRERMMPLQVAGLGVALVGLTLIAIG